jgi:hypothetical protein
VLRFEVSRFELTAQIWAPQNGARRKASPAATPSWKLVAAAPQ